MVFDLVGCMKMDVEMSKKIAWVAGATGFTGREVVRNLVERGVEVIAHVRPDSSRLEEWTKLFGEMGVRVDSTAWDPEALRESVGRVQPDLVYCLIGTTKKRMRANSRGKENYETIDYGLTAMLVEAASATATGAKQPVFVYLSASGTKENSPFAYFQARWKAEQAVRQSGLPHIIARPGVIRGDREERRVMEELAGVVGDAFLSVAAKLGGKALEERYRSTSDRELGWQLSELGLQLANSKNQDSDKQIYEAVDLHRMHPG